VSVEQCSSNGNTRCLKPLLSDEYMEDVADWEELGCAVVNYRE
jgi:hypothetical protein